MNGHSRTSFPSARRISLSSCREAGRTRPIGSITRKERPATRGTGRWSWSINDIAPVRIEQSMPPWRGIASRMVVALMPPSGQGARIQSWRELGAWYQNLTRDRREATPQIKQKVAELTANVPSLWGKIQALTGFVQTDIRYVAIELGIGGHQPHPAADVFSHRYGDCKDKVTLLSTMLKEIGGRVLLCDHQRRKGSDQRRYARRICSSITRSWPSRCPPTWKHFH